MDLLDKTIIWCICLEGNKSRYESAVKEFSKMGILERVRFYRPKKDPEGGRRGCWNSHIHCIKNSTEYDMALIFEDDIKCVDEIRTALCQVERCINKKPNWDLIRMGGLIRRIKKYICYGVYAAEVDFTHSYFISKKYMQYVLKCSDFNPDISNIHIDEWYRYDEANDYIIYPTPLYQSGDLPTDNVWYKKANFIQTAIQHPLVWERFQTYSNVTEYYLQWLPFNFDKYFNPFLLLLTAVEIYNQH